MSQFIGKSGQVVPNFVKQGQYINEPLCLNLGSKSLKQNMKIIIIANRLPVKIEREEEGFCIVRSEGGLATGLGSLETDSGHYPNKCVSSN